MLIRSIFPLPAHRSFISYLYFTSFLDRFPSSLKFNFLWFLFWILFFFFFFIISYFASSLQRGSLLRLKQLAGFYSFIPPSPFFTISHWHICVILRTFGRDTEQFTPNSLAHLILAIHTRWFYFCCSVACLYCFPAVTSSNQKLYLEVCLLVNKSTQYTSFCSSHRNHSHLRKLRQLWTSRQIFFSVRWKVFQNHRMLKINWNDCFAKTFSVSSPSCSSYKIQHRGKWCWSWEKCAW